MREIEGTFNISVYDKSEDVYNRFGLGQNPGLGAVQFYFTYDIDGVLHEFALLATTLKEFNWEVVFGAIEKCRKEKK